MSPPSQAYLLLFGLHLKLNPSACSLLGYTALARAASSMGPAGG